MLGGIGPCGRPICCRTYLGDFTPVSIKMAKEQNLSLNPTKISGLCDRLMCCLKYEQDHYEATRKRMPRVGREIITPDGVGTINAINVLSETVRVRIAVGDSFELREYPIDDCQRPGADAQVQQGGDTAGEAPAQPRPPKPERPERPERPEGERPDKPRGPRGDRPEKPPRPDRPPREKGERPQKGERAQRPDRPPRPPKDGQSAKQADRPAEPEKLDVLMEEAAPVKTEQAAPVEETVILAEEVEIRESAQPEDLL